jgi:hypothetical protein
MSGSSTADQQTLQKVLQMLNHLFKELLRDNAALRDACKTPEGRERLCKQYGISTAEGPGYAMVHYHGSTTESPLVPWILQTFEAAMGGKPTSLAGTNSDIGPGTFCDTKLWHALYSLLTNPELQQQFIKANKDERVKLLSDLEMQDDYQERTALSDYTQDGTNQFLGERMKTIEETLYNHHEFVC